MVDVSKDFKEKIKFEKWKFQVSNFELLIFEVSYKHSKNLLRSRTRRIPWMVIPGFVKLHPWKAAEQKIF